MEGNTIDIDVVPDIGDAGGFDDVSDEEYVDTDNGKKEESFTIKNFKEIKNTVKMTNPQITKYEKTQLIGIRAQQLSTGALPLVDIGDLSDTVKIAEKELMERKLPLIVRRYMPNGEYEDWTIDELVI